MKFSAAVVVSLIICILGCVLALRYIEPIQFEIQQKYGLTLEQLKEKCDSKDKSLYTKIIADQTNSSNVRGQLTEILVKKAKAKKGEVTSKDWDKWTKQICTPNKILRKISKSAINKVQQCVDKTKRLNEAEKLQAQTDLFNNFCDKVKISAWFSYMSSQAGNP